MHPRPRSLPAIRARTPPTALRAVALAQAGCYDPHRRLLIDEGYGDHNISLFRLRDRRKYVRDVPSAFVPALREVLRMRPADSRELRIATEHNEAVEAILTEPKETYLQRIRVEREAERVREAAERAEREFVRGEDVELREHQEQLSFNYLPERMAEKWFTLRDRSPDYRPPVFEEPLAPASPAVRAKARVRKGHIFFSDERRRK